MNARIVLFLLALLLGSLLPLVAQDELYSFDSLSKRIHLDDQGDWIYVRFDTGAMKGPHIVRAEVRAPRAYLGGEAAARVVFEYYFIEDIPHSFRTMESTIVTWKVMKADWNLWKKDKQFYVLHRDDVPLLQEDIDLIKSQW